ncbi:hypothetical protein BST95_02595 [Halioglobus japonicus]|uniref:Uncharacterized protein n=1 Tax=Halioglobus japonicus TaxID=930805 RepID=A0AAP8SLD8_9GAMM|nr:hypothetical protein BST95_02595 [Halioglobus japonicus]PLW84512.1 hypothetical protein C0029_18855 [Halioglobus japonicus]
MIAAAITITIGLVCGLLIGFVLGISSNEISEGTDRQFNSSFLTAIYKKRPIYINMLTGGILGLSIMVGLTVVAAMSPKWLGYPSNYLMSYSAPSYVVGILLGKIIRYWVWKKYLRFM